MRCRYLLWRTVTGLPTQIWLTHKVSVYIEPDRRCPRDRQDREPLKLFAMDVRSSSSSWWVVLFPRPILLSNLNSCSFILLQYFDTQVFALLFTRCQFLYAVRCLAHVILFYLKRKLLGIGTSHRSTRTTAARTCLSTIRGLPADDSKTPQDPYSFSLRWVPFFTSSMSDISGRYHRI